MNNEEKILTVLGALVTKVDKLDYGQTEMRSDIADLKRGYLNLEGRICDLVRDVGELSRNQEKIINKLDGVIEQTATLTEFHTEISHRIEALETV